MKRIKTTSALILLAVISVGGTGRAAQIDPRLHYLTALRNGSAHSSEHAAPRSLAELAPRFAREESFAGSLRFVGAPDQADFSRLRALGVKFFDFGAGPAGSRSVYPARIPYAALPALQVDATLAAIECAWRPGAPPPLAQSRPQVEADLAWGLEDPTGHPLTGDGVLLCDLDTGANFYHASLFKQTGVDYAWLDVDGSGALSPGDAVDLDGDGSADPGESLRYIEAGQSGYANDPSRFNPAYDFLYNDADNDAVRDYGPPAYGELAPTYGERFFAVNDLDADDRLDPGERLLGLGSSKVRAIYGRNGHVYRRGVDLLQSEGDYWGHGSQVTGILAGGWPRHHALSGIAPGLEILQSVNEYISEPPFLVPIEARLAWARQEGADIVLIEDGEWIWEYMDGSSNVEIMLNELAADDGVIVVVPAGNLATGNMHTSFAGNGAASLYSYDAHVMWLSFLWKWGAESWPLLVTPPGSASSYPVPSDGSDLLVEGYRIYGFHGVSARMTHRRDLRIVTEPEGGVLDGTWTFTVAGQPGAEVHAYFLDDLSGWYSPNSWEEPDPTHTVTWPATADSALSVAAYNPSGDGDINSFSGWGPRIDGRPAVTLAAPGSTVRSTHPSMPADFIPFGGTSGAGPHVAGAVALLKQLFPDLDSGRCRRLLSDGAQTDIYTTDVDRWGAGKLRIMGAIEAAVTAAESEPPDPELGLDAHPNPFSGSTTLRLRLPVAGPAELRVFTVEGRQVCYETVPDARPGSHNLVWDGSGAGGRRLASGEYFIYLKQGERWTAKRVTLLR